MIDTVVRTYKKTPPNGRVYWNDHKLIILLIFFHSVRYNDRISCVLVEGNALDVEPPLCSIELQKGITQL